MSKIAIVTGASGGIGKEISKSLLKLGYEVYGIGRDYSDCDIKDEHFIKMVMNLTNTKLLADEIKKIRKNGDVCVLVNNAGVAYYGLHEELKPEMLSELVKVNLEVPMLLANLLLRDLKKNEGTIINISSVTATHASPHACAYGATKAGLSAFSKSLFEEQRKYGLKVINIEPDLTATKLYRNANFETSDEENARLLATDVAEAVEYCLTNRAGVVVTNLTVRPQLNQIKKK